MIASIFLMVLEELEVLIARTDVAPFEDKEWSHAEAVSKHRFAYLKTSLPYTINSRVSLYYLWYKPTYYTCTHTHNRDSYIWLHQPKIATSGPVIGAH